MTPTEQDEKLVDNTDVGIILSDYLGSEWNGNMRDDIVAMVNSKFAADRKRVELEARIDELTLLADFQMGDITVMGRNERSWRDRISELEQNPLKALEEV